MPLGQCAIVGVPFDIEVAFLLCQLFRFCCFALSMRAFDAMCAYVRCVPGSVHVHVKMAAAMNLYPAAGARPYVVSTVRDTLTLTVDVL